MFTVSFYKFSKKKNSTKRPGSGSLLVSADCVLKDPSGVIAPELYVYLNDETIPANANYAYIPKFNRYYYVTEWTWNKGAWTVSLTVDSLASFKTEIGASTQYVLRSQSDYDLNVADDIYPFKAAFTHEFKSFSVEGSGELGDPFPYHTIPNGYYVVGIINSDSNAVGSCSYYRFIDSEFKKFKALLMNVNNYTSDSTEIERYRQDFNPISYIASVKWFPCSIPVDSGTPISSIPFGWWTLSGSFICYRITGAPAVVANAAVIPQNNMPRHPRLNVFGSYLENEPYSKYTLVFNPFGIFPLPALQIARGNSLYLTCSVDPISGEGALRVFTPFTDGGTTGQVDLVHATTKIGIDIPMAQISRDFVRNTNSLLGVVGSVASALLGNVEGIVSAAQGFVDMKASDVPQVQASGSMGSLAIYYLSTKPRLVCEFMQMPDHGPAYYGRPLCKVKQISTLSGFIKCGNVEIDLPATEQEHNDIIRVMQEGFEYE